MTFTEIIPALLRGDYARRETGGDEKTAYYYEIIKIDAPGPEASISYRYTKKDDSSPGQIRYRNLGFRLTREKLSCNDWCVIEKNEVPE